MGSQSGLDHCRYHCRLSHEVAVVQRSLSFSGVFRSAESFVQRSLSFSGVLVSGQMPEIDLLIYRMISHDPKANIKTWR